MHTGRMQYAPCHVDGHLFRLPWATHPFVTFQKKITTFPIPIRVWCFKNDFQQQTPGSKTVYPPRLVYFIRTVIVKEFPHCQSPGSISHSTVQDLHFMKTLQAFGDTWLTNKPKHLRSSRWRELSKNLSPAFNICSYTPTPCTLSY